MFSYNNIEMERTDLIKYCILDCIKGNYVPKQTDTPGWGSKIAAHKEEDIESNVAQVLYNELGNKVGLGLLVDWTMKYYYSNYELAKCLMDSLSAQKKKDKLTIDYLVKLARPYDEDDILVDFMSDDDDYAEKKTEFEETHFQAADVFYQIYDKKLRLFNKSQFTVKYEHLTFGKEKAEFISRWFKDTDKKLYEAVDFLPPPLPVPKNVFNTWDITERPDETSSDDDDVSTDIIYKFFDKLTNSGEDACIYLLKFVAHLIQFPATKPEVGVFFTSAQGSGKDTFFKLLTLIIGESLTSINSDPDNVFGKYNIDSRLNKLVLVLQEADNLRAYSGKIKDTITCRTTNLANKGTKQITVRDFTRLFVFSNNDNILKIEPDDRRWVIYNCFNFLFNKEPTFFKELHAALDDPKVISKFRKELMDYNISQDFNFQINRPKTDKFNDLKTINTPSIIKWAYEFNSRVEIIEEKDKGKIIEYKSRDLCDLYNDYCKMNYETNREINPISFSLQLKRYFYINNIWVGFEHKKTKNCNAFLIHKDTIHSIITGIYGYSNTI